MDKSEAFATKVAKAHMNEFLQKDGVHEDEAIYRVNEKFNLKIGFYWDLEYEEFCHSVLLEDTNGREIDFLTGAGVDDLLDFVDTICILLQANDTIPED